MEVSDGGSANIRQITTPDQPIGYAVGHYMIECLCNCVIYAYILVMSCVDVSALDSTTCKACPGTFLTGTTCTGRCISIVLFEFVILRKAITWRHRNSCIKDKTKIQNKKVKKKGYIFYFFIDYIDNTHISSMSVGYV